MKSVASKIFVTGMVRSGTTLVSRCLQAHGEVVCATDPYMGYFRALRNDLCHAWRLPDMNPQSPLTDFFCDQTQSLERYQEANLNFPLHTPIKDILEDIARFAEANSPKILPCLDEATTAQSYKQLFMSLLGILGKVYAEGDARVVGFKQTWVEAFAAPIANTFPEARVIHVLRDPRALVASWKKSSHLSHDYPFLMLIRHWRKSVALALRNQKYIKNYTVLRYEDFVANPEITLRNLCHDMGLEFDPRMVDVTSFSSGSGAKWLPNTSYEVPVNEISQQFTAAWAKRLDQEEISLVEYLCEPEMNAAGYACATSRAARKHEVLFSTGDMERVVSGKTEWLSRFGGAYAPAPNNLSKELARRLLWEKNKHDDGECDPRLAEMFFVHPPLARPGASLVGVAGGAERMGEG